MNTRPVDIIEFICHPDLLNDQSLSLAQRTCLKSIYGLPLLGEEASIYRRATGREDYIPREHNEATILVGRRGGKTSKIAVPIACYEAFRNHKLPRGERAEIVLIAPVLDQARIAFRFVRNYLQSSPVLSAEISSIRENKIHLRNGITIGCYPCSLVAVRGAAVVAAICDEVAFWPHKQTASNPEEEVFAALRPAMSTFPHPKLIKISTPFKKEGILWKEYQQRVRLPFPVWQLSSPETNPGLRPEMMERFREQSGEERFRREFLAEFTDSVNAWTVPEQIDACVVDGRTNLPPVSGGRYLAAVDPAFQRNNFALAVLHKTQEGTIVIDVIRRWAGTRSAPLGFERVMKEIAQIVKPYGVRKIVGDQYCAPVIGQEFEKLGFQYEEVNFSHGTRERLFSNLKHLMIQQKIELLDDPNSLGQLRSLEEHKTSSGNLEICTPHGTKDDLAVAIALGAFKLCEQRKQVYYGMI